MVDLGMGQIELGRGRHCLVHGDCPVGTLLTCGPSGGLMHIPTAYLTYSLHQGKVRGQEVTRGNAVKIQVATQKCLSNKR